MKKTIIYPILATTFLATAALQTATVHAEDSTTVSTSAEANYQTLSKTLNDKAKKAKEAVNKSTAPQDDKDSINTAIDSLLDKAQAELKSASEADYDVDGKLQNAFDEGRKKLEREGKRAIRIGELNDEYNQVVAEAREQNVSVDELSDKDFSFEYYFGLVRTLPGDFDYDADKAKKALDTFRTEKLGDTRSDSEQSSQASKSSESSESSTSTSSTTSVSDKQTSDKTNQSSPSETKTEVATDEKASEDKTNTSDEGFDFSKLVGTWRNGEGRTITINADGTYSGDETGEVGTEGTRYNDTDIWSVGIRPTGSISSGLLYYAPAGTSYPAVGQEKDASDISQDRFMMTNAYPEGTANTTYYRVATNTASSDKVDNQTNVTESPDKVSSQTDNTDKKEGKIDGLTNSSTGTSQTAPSQVDHKDTKVKEKKFKLPSTGDTQSVITIIIGFAIIIIAGIFGYTSKKHK